ncbi:hypothetical protein [Viridibacillus arvi]|uniref:hypothetical protein n=1 Tax=Viridibacillus arvi TaxID=263475 RepID=UPI0034CDFACA
MNYKDIAQALQEPFPNGTVQFPSSSKRQAHIPVQVYINRLEKVAGEHWSWTIIGEPMIVEADNAVIVKGELSILGAKRGGMGFSHYVRGKDSKSVSAFKNAVNAAESDAIRSACDKFLMGWSDLAPYRDWGSNAGIDINLNNRTEAIPEKDVERVCQRCAKKLTDVDQLFLEVNRIKLPYCTEHVPKHLIKKT